MKKLITGVKPTGASMHLWNLLGAVLPFGELAKGNDSAIFIADLHALTSVKNGDLLRKQSHELAVEYFAIYGLDTPIRIFRQSDIVLLPKLNWILNNVTPLSLMLRAHSFKDSQNKSFELVRNQLLGLGKQITENEYFSGNNDLHDGIERILKLVEIEILPKAFEEALSSNNLNMGVFNYPILMAADIIGYDIDLVPVGQDQKQHLEMARDIARAFNKTYGADVFKLPEERIRKKVAIIPGVDGRKMSKSYDNFIGVFDDEKTLKKRVMSIVTDSRGVDDAKDPETCNVFSLIKTFGAPDRVAEIRRKYETANSGYGYGHAKTELLEILTDYLRPYRERREALLQDTGLIESRLAEGARVMNARIEEKMAQVSAVVGL